MEVRLAVRGDAEPVFRLLRQFAASYSPRREAFERTFPLLLLAGYAELLVADDHGEVVGYALAFVLPTLYASGLVLELQELVVEERRRNQGIGSLLVREALSRAWGRGCVEVTVPTRRAAGFYKSLGFTETATYFKLRAPDTGE